MKISVVIIAHNEEQYIAKCIESVLSQSRKPDEIILINHNSTDRTKEIAERYPITVIEYEGPRGQIHARTRAFAAASGEQIFCIDGDSYAAENWVEALSAILSKEDMVMVGSWIRMSGTFYTLLASSYWYFTCPSTGERATDYLWGASLGLRSNEKESIIKALEEGAELSIELGLSYNPEEYWLALFMNLRGNLEVTNKTWVMAHAKETNSVQSLMRGAAAGKIRRTIKSFLAHNDLPAV